MALTDPCPTWQSSWCQCNQQLDWGAGRPSSSSSSSSGGGQPPPQTLRGTPAATHLLEPPVHHHRHALGDALRHVLGQRGPDDDVIPATRVREAGQVHVWPLMKVEGFGRNGLGGFGWAGVAGGGDGLMQAAVGTWASAQQRPLVCCSASHQLLLMLPILSFPE